MIRFDRRMLRSGGDRSLLLRLMEDGLIAVDPGRAVSEHLHIEGNRLRAGTTVLEISRQGVEKHLKQMLEIGLITRKSEAYPKLRFVYSLPEHSRMLISQLQDIIGQFVENMKDEFTRKLEDEEQKFLLGITSREHYEKIKAELNLVLEKIS